MKLKNKIELLKDPSSPYYCGSSCLLSLEVLYDSIEKNSDHEFKKNFSSFKKTILSLFDEDCVLFEISKKKEPLSEEDWKKTESIFHLYEETLSFLHDLIDYCRFTKKERYLPFLISDYEFLEHLAQDNLELFSRRESIPMTFFRVRNDVLAVIRKEFRYEC